MKDLVKISPENDFDVILDIRYAGANNVTRQKFYENDDCFLHQEAAQKLKNAVILAQEYDLKLKIFDGFRPLKAQEFLFAKFPDSGFVSDPKNGSIPHCRGIAVDLTLVDKNGKELEMGTDFDDFTELAFHSCKKLSGEAKKNRELLLKIMTKAGWDFFDNEWWHYQLFNPRSYKII
jgi:zinc D-Ala-D-Ala dipeptidase